MTVKVSALPTVTAVTDDDLLLVVDDPSGTPTTKKITAANFASAVAALASFETALLADAGITTALATHAAFTSRYVPLAGGVLLTATGLSIANGAAVDVIWGTEVSDPDNWSVGTATITVPAGKGGRYIVCYTGDSNGTLGPLGCVGGYINAAPVYETGGSSGPFLDGINLTFVRTLVAGDTIIFKVNNNGGATRLLASRVEIAPI